MSAEKKVPFKTPVYVTQLGKSSLRFGVWQKENNVEFLISAPCLTKEEAEFNAAAINEKAAREKEG